MFKLTLELDPEYRCDEVEKKDDETRRKKNNSLMKIYLPDSHFGNMVFSKIGDLWEET